MSRWTIDLENLKDLINAMGIVGAAMVARWSWGLLRYTSCVLLDKQAPETVRNAVREAIEAHEGDRIADLHVWSIGPDLYAAAIALVSYEPKQPAHYKELIGFESQPMAPPKGQGDMWPSGSIGRECYPLELSSNQTVTQ